MSTNGSTRQKIAIVTDRVWGAEIADRLRGDFDVLSLSDLSSDSHDVLAGFNPEYVYFPYWSKFVPAAIYDKFECVIFHMTDLPFGRGGSPLQNLIARGFQDTKISALRCVGEVDAGPIYLQRALSLNGAAEEIFLRAAREITGMIATITLERPVPTNQVGEPTVFKRRRPEDGNLKGVQTLDAAFDLIRMLDAEGYPNAFLKVGAFKLTFTRAARKVGCVVADVRIEMNDEEHEGET